MVGQQQEIHLADFTAMLQGCEGPFVFRIAPQDKDLIFHLHQ
jgi:hypothetical protein